MSNCFRLNMILSRNDMINTMKIDLIITVACSRSPLYSVDAGCEAIRDETSFQSWWAEKEKVSVSNDQFECCSDKAKLVPKNRDILEAARTGISTSLVLWWCCIKCFASNISRIYFINIESCKIKCINVSMSFLAPSELTTAIYSLMKWLMELGRV